MHYYALMTLTTFTEASTHRTFLETSFKVCWFSGWSLDWHCRQIRLLPCYPLIPNRPWKILTVLLFLKLSSDQSCSAYPVGLPFCGEQPHSCCFQTGNWYKIERKNSHNWGWWNDGTCCQNSLLSLHPWSSAGQSPEQTWWCLDLALPWVGLWVRSSPEAPSSHGCSQILWF